MIIDIDFKRILDELLLDQTTRIWFSTERENNIIIPVLTHFEDETIVALNLKFFDDNSVVYNKSEDNKASYYHIENYRGYKINIWKDFQLGKRFNATTENIKNELNKYASLKIKYSNETHYSALTAYIKKEK